MNRSSGSQQNVAVYSVLYCEAQGTPAQSHVFSALTCDELVQLSFTRSCPYSLEWVGGAGGGRWMETAVRSVEVELSKFGLVYLVEVLGGKLPQATMSRLFVSLTSYRLPLVSCAQLYCPGARSSKLDQITYLSWNWQIKHVLTLSSSTGYTVFCHLRNKCEVVAWRMEQVRLASLVVVVGRV